MKKIELISKKYQFEKGELEDAINQRGQYVSNLKQAIKELEDAGKEVPEVLKITLRHHNEFLFYLVTSESHQECIILFFKEIENNILEELEIYLQELKQSKYN